MLFSLLYSTKDYAEFLTNFIIFIQIFWEAVMIER